jgi:CRISPR-associated protein Cas2
MYYIITYDIADDKQRKKLSDLLEGYGVRVNYSVFECELSQTQLKKLLLEIEEENLLDKKVDSLRFYHMHKTSIPKSFEICKKQDPFEEDIMFV